MNLYPLLLASISKSRAWVLFLISNSAWLVLILVGLISWHLWINDYLTLVQESLQNTQLSGDQVRDLLTQTKSAGTTILLFTPLLLVGWRIVWPISMHMLKETSSDQSGSYLITSIGFDITKILVGVIAILLIKQTLATSILGASTILLIAIFSFSLLFFYQVAAISGHRSLKKMLINWFRHLDIVLFLHSIDIALSIVTFCIIGLILASNVYAPTILAVILTLVMGSIIGKLWLIRKGLWTYAISEMTNITQS